MVSDRDNWQLTGFFQGIGAVSLMGSCAIASGNCAFAQTPSNIVPDATLGAESSVVVPNFDGLPVEAIGGGAQRGQNLFHSFQQFNVSEGRGAYFFSPDAAIGNILARVTGNNPSQILGTLGTFGNSQPNLFLINPNGMIFGSNASLDVGGSFVATTANAIRLGNTGLFSASEPQTSNLLAINPNAFFYNQLSNQGQIVNRSTATTTVLGTPTIGLQVPDGRSLLLVGGDIKLDGGRLFALGGRIELGGVAQNGIVELIANGNELRLGFPTDVARADVSLTNESEVNVRDGDGGSIAINARNVEVLGGSKVRAGIASGLGTPESKAGDIEVNAIGTMTVVGESFIANAVQADGVGKGGDINITTESLFVTEGGQINALTSGQGDAGSLTILARDIVSFDGTDRNGNSGGAASSVEQGAVGNAGNINITTGSLFVTNGAQLSSSTLGEGNAGSMKITATDTVSFDGVSTNGFSSGAFSSVEAGVVGNGGDIEMYTNSLSVTNGARLIANTLGQGNAGSIRITATDTVSFDGVGSNGLSSLAASAVGSGILGDGGDVEITTGSLSVSNGAYLITSTSGQGNAGSVRIRATDTVSFDGVGSNGITSGANSDVTAGAVGNSGGIEITTGSLSVRNGASLSASTSGKGNAGRVRITATDTVNFDRGDISSFVYLGAVGDGGDIEINTGSLSVSNGASLLANTLGQGNAGSVKITATDTVRFDRSYAASAVGSGAVGNGGDIEISSSSLSFTNGAFLSASTDGQGNAGNVRITATDQVSFDGVGSNGLHSKASSTVGVGAVGNGGDIEITTGSLEVNNGAFLSADTFGQGNAGSVRITANDKVRFDGVASNGASSGAFTSVGSRAIGNGGDIEITTGSLSLSNGAVLFAGTSGQGNSGNVKITANDSLSVTNGAYLSTSTAGQGNAGSVRIIATDSVSFDGVGSNRLSSAAFSSVEKGAVGNGGDIEITTNSLSLTNGASLFAGTFGKGKAGSLRVNATDTVRFDEGFATTLVGSGAVGNGGDIEITTSSFEVTNGFQLLASTFGQGNAGNIKITATDEVRFNGVGSNGQPSGAFSAVGVGGQGKGGDIEITSGSLSLTDAFISSLSGGTGTAGDITLSTRQNLEMNRSSILATTQVGDGGNMRLRVGDLLLMRNDSNISTTAGVTGAGGDGGNININAGFVVAVPVEDSDITANAFNGRGGNINITTQGIYGLTFRERDIPASSDITASSQFGLDGEFQLDLLTNVDPSRGLGELPADVVDATRQIDRRCTPTADQKSSFVLTGRGGLPPSPNEVLQGDSVITNWVTLDSEAENTSAVTPQTNLTPSRPKQLVEAQTWVYDPNGEVILTAQAPAVIPNNSWSKSPSCDAVGRGREVF